MIRNLQALRAICAVLIYIHHAGPDCPVVSSFGDAAVAIFFILSGFVMSASYEHREVSITPRAMSRFMYNRVVRIYPLYLAALLIMVFTVSWKIFALDALMLQSWIPDINIAFAGNGPAWFVSSLMFSYLMFLPTQWLLRNRRKLFYRILAVTLVAYCCLILLLRGELMFYLLYVCPPIRFIDFMLGMVLWDQLPRLQGWQSKAQPAAILAIVLCIGQMLLWEYVPMRLTLCSYWWPVALLLIASLTLADRQSGLLTKVFHWRPLVIAGNVSFTFYILHRPWIDLMHNLLPNFNIYLQLVIGISLLLPIAYAVNRWFEAPMYKKLKV